MNHQAHMNLFPRSPRELIGPAGRLIIYLYVELS